MNEGLQGLGRRVLALCVVAVMARGVGAQDLTSLESAGRASAESIARMRFEALDLKAIKPPAPPLHVTSAKPPVPTTQSFTFEWSSDTVSFLVYAESGSGSVAMNLEPGTPERPNSFGSSASFVFPGVDDPVPAGKYRFDVVGSGSDAAKVTPKERRGAQPGSGILDLNLFVLDGCGLTSQQLAEGLTVFAEVFADAQISLGKITAVKVTGAADYLSPGSFEEAQSDAGTLSRQLTVDPPSRTAANLFFVKSIPDLFGFSQGIPVALGIPGASAGGVVISVDTHNTDRGFDSRELGLTMAHETGHSMGLYHTSEKDASQHDTISDTPECSGDFGGGCPDAPNIMFWAGHGLDLSGGQAYVLRRSVIVR